MKKAKYFLIGLLLMAITACGDYKKVYPPFVDKAVKLCENNGGYKTIRVHEEYTSYTLLSIICNNNAYFHNIRISSEGKIYE